MAAHSKTKISARESWLLRLPGALPWSDIVDQHIHGLKQNKTTIKNTSRELDSLVDTNPLAFFKLGYHLVPDNYFHPDKPKLSDWTHTAAKSLIIQNPIAYVTDLKLHLNHDFDGLLPLLYDSLRIKLGALDAKTLKKRNPVLFKDILKIVELISAKHPDYYVRILADEPEYAKYFSNIGVTAELIYKLIKIANQLDYSNQFEEADQIDAIIKAIGDQYA